MTPDAAGFVLCGANGGFVRGVEGGDTVRIEVKEGLHLRFREGPMTAPGVLFQTALALSALLEGKSVRCSGFMPGISLVVSHKFVLGDGQVNDAVLKKVWAELEPMFAQWIEMGALMPCLHLQLATGGLMATMDSVVRLDPGVAELEVVREWGPQ